MMPEKLQAARLKLVKERPYLAAALWAAVPVERPGLGSVTMDQWWRLYYDPAVVAWPVDRLAGILYHAVCHLLRSHPERAEALMMDPAAWNVACFPAGVSLADGARVSDMPTSVITPQGRENAIPMCRQYSGPLISVTVLGMEVLATPEHPFLVYKKLKQTDVTPSRRGIHPEPEWVPAGDLRVGYYVVVPTLPGAIASRNISLEPFLPYKEAVRGYGRNRVVLKEGLPLTKDTAWLLGLYTAEGSGKQYVTVSLGLHEEDLARRALDISRSLGFNGSVKKEDHALSVRLGGPVLARAMRAWCGQGSHNKRIPEFILLHEDLEILRAFLCGLLARDGYVDKNKGFTCVATVSEPLVGQIRLALARLGVGAHVVRRLLSKRCLRGRELGESVLYTIHWREVGPVITQRVLNGQSVNTWPARWKRVPEGIAYPVNVVREVNYRGRVYNFSTESHQYIACGLLVHNCDAEINDDLRQEKVSLPEGAVYPEMFDPPLPTGGLAEEYYDELLRRRQNKRGRAFQGSGETGRSGQGSGESQVGAGRDGTDAGARQGLGSGTAAGGASPTGGESLPGAGGRSGTSESGDAGGSSAVSPGQTSNLSRPAGHPVEPLTGSPRSQGGEGRGSGVDETPTPSPGAGRCGSCATGQAEPWEEPPPDESEIPGIMAAQAELIRRQVAQEIIRIAQAARDRGEIPGHWRRWAEEKLTSRVDWRRELASAVRQAVSSTQGAADYTYRRPSRRQAAYGEVVMPSLYSPIPEVAVVVDTSGSMSDRQVSQALAEVAGVLRGLGNRTAVHVLAVDAAVQACQRVFRREQVVLSGGGGTDMGVGLEAALKLRPRPEVVVVITDGHTPWPARPPAEARVIVVLVGDGESPGWARTIKVDV